MTVLFLDFDGVLHPNNNSKANLFIHRNHFEEVMRSVPKIDIVISSSWRLHYEFDYLKQLFSPDIAARITGVTPRFAELDDSEVPDSLIGYPREAECSAFMRANRPASERWFALDDMRWLFRPFSQRLFEVDGDVGLTHAVAVELQDRIKEMECAL